MVSYPNMKHQGVEYFFSQEPPASIYEEAKETFDIDFYTRGTVFAFAPYIHSKKGKAESHLIHHELIHFKQQEAVGGPEKWWRIYFDDAQQRMEWELEAYREQYKFIVENYRQSDHWPLLKQIGEHLVRMYNLGLTLQDAIKLVRDPSLSTPKVK